jgi:hypothetical protein
MANGYMMFVKHNRKSIAAKHSKLSITEVAKKMGEEWRKLSDVEKDKYNKMAADAPKPAKKTPAEKPKRPLSAYMKFVKAKRSKVAAAHPTLKLTEIAKKLGEMWRGLSDADKAKYK